MYSTCLHCHQSLGRNDAIEHFPIGRRLAFDADKGRLWVVCARCARWNLTPIEERWEAVEDCDREFRGRRIRAQTDNVGLARLDDGTELIRIGAPLRPEFAAWRYGGVFRRRLMRNAGVVTGIGASIVGGGMLAAGSPIAAALSPLVIAPMYVYLLHSLRPLRNTLGTRVVGEDGKPLDVTRGNLDHTRVIPRDDGSLGLSLRHSYGRQELTGDRAVRALSTLLLRVNRGGGTNGAIAEATSFIADSGAPARAIVRIAREADARTGDFEERAAAIARGPRGNTVGEYIADQIRLQALSRSIVNGATPTNPGALHRLPRVYRLALEMSLHETSEQFALDQELATLEREWREAEEIAAIADSLLPLR